MGERQIVTVDRVAAGGDGIGHLADGRIVFVEGALPGEQVVADVHTSKRDFAKASTLEVAVASPDRVEPPCPARAAGCGGCPWQHVSPGAQLRLKAEIVADALRRTAKLPAAQVAVGAAVAPWAYRTTVRVAAGAGGRVGFRGSRSHQVVLPEACPITHPVLSELLPTLSVRGADELTLRVSAATGEITALPSPSTGVVRGLPEGARCGPDATVTEEVAGHQLRVSAASFFQSGPAAAELLVQMVRGACGAARGSGPLLDAYGGVGLFAATLATDAHAIVVESSASACADARVNLGARAEVHCMPFERWPAAEVPLVVADPARAGLGADGAAVVAATSAPRVVLVSCDPVAMARDTALLGTHGYRHEGSLVLDLFPQTPHAEVVTTFTRG